MRACSGDGLLAAGQCEALEGPQHPDRDAQFRYLNARVKAFLRQGDPVISVDTKKKELIGAFRNGGRTWRRQGQPRRVLAHDFPNLASGKAIPYGAYDVAQDQAFVNVGITPCQGSPNSPHSWSSKSPHPEGSQVVASAGFTRPDLSLSFSR